MFEFDLTNILYIAFRLAPFIIVCVFTLQSFLNWDLKGLIYLVGLLFACFCTVLGNSLSTSSESADASCDILSIGPHGSRLSILPLSTAVFSYTFFYLLTFIINMASLKPANFIGKNTVKAQRLNMVMQQNIPTMILFPLLILIDAGWNLTYGCNSFQSIGISLVISGIVGIIWGLVIAYTKNPELQYISSGGLQVCNRPSKTMYRCKIPKISS